MYAWQGGASRIVINCMSPNAGGLLSALSSESVSVRQRNLYRHLRAEPKIAGRRQPHKRISSSTVAGTNCFLQVEKRVKVDRPTKTSHCSVYGVFWVSMRPSRLYEGSPTKSNVSLPYIVRAHQIAVPTGADGQQKLIRNAGCNGRNRDFLSNVSA